MVSVQDLEKVTSLGTEGYRAWVLENESNITECGLGSSDVQDIVEIMSDYFSYILNAVIYEPEYYEMCVEDAGENLLDDHEEDWLDTAVSLSKQLFKKITNKELE